LLLSLVIGHVVADSTSASRTEEAVMTGKMTRHAAHHRALYAPLCMRRRTSQAHRQQTGGRGYWKQKGFHEEVLLNWVWDNRANTPGPREIPLSLLPPPSLATP
jgi:hypothetical protein